MRKAVSTNNTKQYWANRKCAEVWAKKASGKQLRLWGPFKFTFIRNSLTNWDGPEWGPLAGKFLPPWPYTIISLSLKKGEWKSKPMLGDKEQGVTYTMCSWSWKPLLNSATLTTIGLFWKNCHILRCSSMDYPSIKGIVWFQRAVLV